jgi:outer membrane receptor protein involved in Fe transport
MSNVLIAACTLLLTTFAGAAEIRGIVVDISGTPVIDATVVRVVGGREEPVTLAPDGTFTVPAEVGEIRVRAAGFAEAVVHFTLESTELIRVVLQPASFADSIVVTADRGTSRLPSAASATVLTSAELNNAASGALDDVLRQTPGFTLFRRSTSRTANPTTQGVTLRGVSGSGASRTLVLADGVPLNDPFGSWVYWNRVPLAAIDRVEVVRGGAGDLYGADALGGVIQVLTFSPTRPRLRAAVDGGSHSTGRGSLFGGTRLGGRRGRQHRRRHHPRSRGGRPGGREGRQRLPHRLLQRGDVTRALAGLGPVERLRRGSEQRHAGAGQHHRLASALG